MSPDIEHTVTFRANGCSTSAPAGVTIKAAAALAGVPLDAPCGGLGTCGRCAVIADGGLEPPTADERVLLGEERLAAGVRLACRARIVGDVIVCPIDDDGGAQGALRILEEGAAREIVVESPTLRDVEGDSPLLGAVIDIGTTTVVVAIVDLASGERLGSASELNPQHPFGHDVMSRITHVAAHGSASLQEPIAATIDGLIRDVLSQLGEAPSHVREISIAGNTTMIHLLLGIDPAPLGVAPYEPAFLDRVERPAADVGLSGFPAAGAYVLPGISAFVGADITAGLLATGIAEQQRTVLLIDLGTNGEMVLRTPRGLVAASTAAGPALEGASISWGMRAEAGAVERVSLDAAGELQIETIGGGAARGLCGSGLLDLVAVLLETGLLDHTGRLRADSSHSLASRVSETDGTRMFEVSEGVCLAQRDVRQVQLANAAIASGIDMLLDSEGIGVDEVESLIIAGGFGYHVRAEALVRMGMIPDAWRDRVSFAGNSAMTGALMALVDTSARRHAEAIARHVRAVDLAGHPDFQTRFVSAMRFPRQSDRSPGARV
ncbi:MAG TPA: ASKHA domain-containing protein [Coriobacteriia bacterium]|nr:ASKHA domain-containing protein [Coriobacteriia bacterium]